MSIFGTMKTAVSGMNAQANRLGTVGDNIANSSTVGYKRASTAFSSLVLPSTQGSYSSGGVETNVRYSIAEQGGIQYTTSSTDLAIQGEGFFIVSDPNGTPYLTRAGAFVKDATGFLKNTAGFNLMGYPYGSNPPAAVVNGFNGLEEININDFGMVSSPSSNGSFPANLDKGAAVVPAGTRPSDNVAGSVITNKSSLTAYDHAGSKVLYDFYYTKTGTGPDTWEVAVYRQDQSTNGASPTWRFLLLTSSSRPPTWYSIRTPTSLRLAHMPLVRRRRVPTRPSRSRIRRTGRPRRSRSRSTCRT